VELNVLHQVRNILETEVVQRSIRKLGIPMVHAWVFDGEQGQVKELQSNLDLDKDIHAIYRYQFSFERPLVGAGKP
jgi:carbonic anhydrase